MAVFLATWARKGARRQRRTAGQKQSKANETRPPNSLVSSIETNSLSGLYNRQRHWHCDGGGVGAASAHRGLPRESRRGGGGGGGGGGGCCLLGLDLDLHHKKWRRRLPARVAGGKREETSYSNVCCIPHAKAAVVMIIVKQAPRAAEQLQASSDDLKGRRRRANPQSDGQA